MEATHCNIVDQLIPRPGLAARQARAHDQLHSTFLSKLPSEIRICIYKDLLLELGHTRHIIYQDGRLRSVRCIGERYISSKGSHRQHSGGSWGLEHRWCKYLGDRYKPASAFGDSFISLLRTCQRLYVYDNDYASVLSSSTLTHHQIFGGGGNPILVNHI